MTPTHAAAVPRQLVDWRKGADVDPPKPGEVFEAIDAAIAMIERLEAGRLIDGLAVRPMKAREGEIEMIDTDELRRKISSVDIVDHIDIHANVKSTLAELLDNLEEAEKGRTIDEQRIADLMTELNRVGHENEELRAKVSDLTINVEYLGNLKKGYEEFIGKLQDERNDLQTELKEVRYRTAVAHDTIKALRAKIEVMESQAPAMWANSSNIISARISTERGSAGDQHTCSETKTAYHDTPLYLATGAQGEEK